MKAEKTQAPLTLEGQALLDEYLSGLVVEPDNTPRLFAVGFLGLPGSGKSTLADLLGIRLDLPVNRSDQIRRFLNDKGYPGVHPRQDIMPSLAEGRTQFYYKNRTSAIIDANFAEYAAASRASALRYGASLLLVRILCPDDIAIDRLRHRAGLADTGASAATADDYPVIKARTERFMPVKDPYATIDTTLELGPQVEDLVWRLGEDGFVRSAGPGSAQTTS